MQERSTAIRRLLLWLLCLLAGRAAATVLQVPTEYPDIQQAILATAAGDTVLVERGVWNGDLSIPDRSMLLASHHLFSGDTTDVLQTVIQGSGEGPVIQVQCLATRVFRLRGFTIQGGMGGPASTGGNLAGGIHLNTYSSAELSWLRIRQCDSPYAGAAILRYSSWGRLGLDHITVEDCGGSAESSDALIRVYTCTNLRVSHLFHPAGTLAGALLHATADTMAVRSIHLSGLRLPSPIDWLEEGSNSQRHMLFLRANELLVLDGLSLEDCRAETDGLVRVRCTGMLQARDLEFVDCRITGSTHEKNEAQLLHLYGEPLEASGLLARGCRLPFGEHMLSIASSYYIGGSLRNFDLQDNMRGLADTLAGTDGSEIYRGSMLYASSVSLFNGRVEKNETQFPLLFDGSWDGFHRDGPLVSYTAGLSDSSIVDGLHFRDNRLVDPDPAEQAGFGNRGTIFHSRGNNAGTTVIRRCEFIGQSTQREPFWTPTSSRPLHTGLYHEDGSLWLQDCLFYENDPGTIELDANSIRVDNLQLVRPQGPGLLCSNWSGATLLRNVLVQGAWWPGTESGVWQSAAMAVRGDVVTGLENCSIVNCCTPFVLALPETGDAVAELNSCLLWNNQYEQLEYDWGGAGSVVSYAYSLLPETRQEPGNIVADPLFRPGNIVRGFQDASPCIDAGDPAHRDRDNPLLPGRQPLPPSMGTILCDIGHLGGLQAQPLSCLGASPAPVELQIRQQPGAVRLSWNAVTQSSDGCPLSVGRYRVLHSPSPDGDCILLAETSGLAWTVPMPAAGSRQFFRVQALLPESEQ